MFKWLGNLNVVRAIKWANDENEIIVAMIMGFSLLFFVAVASIVFIKLSISALGIRLLILLFLFWGIPSIIINKKIRKEENDT